MKTKIYCMTAVAAALVFAVTRFVQIPIPLGYFCMANGVILAICMIMPAQCGIAAGSVGSALADLLSFPVYALPTLFIKAFMPIVFSVFLRAARKKDRTFLIYVGGYVSMLIPLAGYTGAGMLLYGGCEAGLAQLPGLAVEYFANCVLFTALASVFHSSANFS